MIVMDVYRSGLLIFIYLILLVNLSFASSISAGSERKQSSENPTPPSQRSAASRQSRNERAYITTTRHRTYIKQVRPRIRPVSGSRSRAKGRVYYNKARDYFLGRTVEAKTPESNGSSSSDSSTRTYYSSPLQRTVNSLRISYARHLRKSRYDQRRLEKHLQLTRSDLTQLQTKCETLERNLSTVAQQVARQKKSFDNYKSASQNKIGRIEGHQRRQDLQYFQVFEVSNNNTAEISHLQTVMGGLHGFYGDMSDNIPIEENWNQALSTQDVEIEFESFEEEDQRIEDSVERSYQRITDEINPKLNEQKIALESLQQRLERQDQILESISSEDRQQQSAIEAVVANQNRLSIRMDKINNTLSNYDRNLKSTEERLRNTQQQVENQLTTFSSLQTIMDQINATTHTRTGQYVPGSEPAGLSSNSLSQVVEDRIEHVTYVVEHERERVSNLSRSMRSAGIDIRYLSMKSNNFFSILNKQSNIIHQQNVTVTSLLTKMEQQEMQTADLESALTYYHETVMKLLNIVTNLGQQIRRPISQHKDCHDLWMSGHTESGVYSLVHDMKEKHFYCNMTDSGGWTVIQRRSDGLQDFDRDWSAYKDGFGNIYAEFWLGLDTIRWLTNGRIYTLMVVLEDWFGNQRYAFYDKFLVVGNQYTLRVSGYHGDAGNSLEENDDETFKVRNHDSTTESTTSCAATHKAGWWFTSNCGSTNLNGIYLNVPAQSQLASNDNNPTIMWNPGLSSYMTWRGEDYPLKKISMQIAPMEAINEEILKLFPDSDQTENVIQEESVLTDDSGSSLVQRP